MSPPHNPADHITDRALAMDAARALAASGLGWEDVWVLLRKRLPWEAVRNVVLRRGVASQPLPKPLTPR